jgi:DNA-binding transcriptional MocR family regulator
MTTQAEAASPTLERGALLPLASQLAQWIGARIQAGALAGGARLPSVRDAARRHGLAPSTVVAAYDQLQAQGLVEARAQRGFFVRGGDAVATPRISAPARRDPPLDAAALVRSMFEHGRPQSERAPSPGIGTLPADWLDLPLLHGALRRAMAEDTRDPQSLRYADPAGDARLRAALSTRLATLGIGADASQVVTTVGATTALDLVSQRCCSRATAVLVDEPGWAGGVRAPHADGRAPAAGAARRRRATRRWRVPWKRLLRRASRALYVTVSVLHNPTGARSRRPPRTRCCKLAEAHDLTIVEDDTYAWLAPRTRRGWPQLDGSCSARLHQRLLQDPDAAVARGLPGRVARAGRTRDRHQAAGHADGAGPDRARAGDGAWTRGCCAAMPSA